MLVKPEGCGVFREILEKRQKKIKKWVGKWCREILQSDLVGFLWGVPVMDEKILGLETTTDNFPGRPAGVFGLRLFQLGQQEMNFPGGAHGNTLAKLTFLAAVEQSGPQGKIKDFGESSQSLEVIPVHRHPGLDFHGKKIRAVAEQQINFVAVAVTIKMQVAAVPAVHGWGQVLHFAGQV